MTEIACYTYSLVSVPLYDTLGSEAISYIIDKGNAMWSLPGPELVCASTLEQTSRTSA